MCSAQLTMLMVGRKSVDIPRAAAGILGQGGPDPPFPSRLVPGSALGHNFTLIGHNVGFTLLD